ASGANARDGLRLPNGTPLPPLARPEQILGRDGPPSVSWGDAPNLTPLASAPGAQRFPAGALPVNAGTAAAPRFTVVDGDALVDGATTGRGVLYVTGRLRITGRFDFTGVVAAANGVEITGTGTMTICGALWATGAPALDVTGAGNIRASS